MLYAACWGLIVLVIVAVMLHMEDRRDREKIAAVDRRIAALMDATRRGEEPPEPMQNRPDMTNPSRESLGRRLQSEAVPTLRPARKDK